MSEIHDEDVVYCLAILLQGIHTMSSSFPETKSKYRRKAIEYLAELGSRNASTNREIEVQMKIVSILGSIVYSESLMMDPEFSSLLEDCLNMILSYLSRETPELVSAAANSLTALADLRVLTEVSMPYFEKVLLILRPSKQRLSTKFPEQLSASQRRWKRARNPPQQRVIAHYS